MTIFSLPGGSPIFNRKLPRKISFSLSYALSNAIVLFLFFFVAAGGVGVFALRIPDVQAS